MPLRQKAHSLLDYDGVAIRFTAGDSDSADRYPIALQGVAAGRSDLTLSSPVHYGEARAEYLAQFVRLPLVDASTDHPVFSDWDRAGRSLAERPAAGDERSFEYAERPEAADILGLDYGTPDTTLVAAQVSAEARVGRPGIGTARAGLSPTWTGWLAKVIKSKGVVVKSRQGLYTFGAGLPSAEVHYLWALIERALA